MLLVGIVNVRNNNIGSDYTSRPYCRVVYYQQESQQPHIWYDTQRFTSEVVAYNTQDDTAFDFSFYGCFDND